MCYFRLLFAFFVFFSSVSVLHAQQARYDTDDDGLIEVRTLDELNAIRYDLDGDGCPTPACETLYKRAFGRNFFPGVPADLCLGYELVADVDFSGSIWGSGGSVMGGWVPIGDEDHPYTATFEGNGHVICNLYIDRPGRDWVGFFGYVSSKSGGVLRNVGMEEVDVRGHDNVGSLAGLSDGYASYATGRVRGNSRVGGLVGAGGVVASYANTTVAGKSNVGGLAGVIYAGGSLTNYATGDVSGKDAVGGLVGTNLGPVVYSYARGDVSGDTSGWRPPDGTPVGGLVGTNNALFIYLGRITSSYYDASVQVTNPGGASNYDGGINSLGAPLPMNGFSLFASELSSWDDPIDHDGLDTTPPVAVWDLGAAGQFPVLSIDFNGDGTASWQEFGDQLRGVPSTSIARFVADSYTVREDAPSPLDVEVELSTPLSFAVTVCVVTEGSAVLGADYTLSATALDFLPGTHRQSFYIETVYDTVAEPLEEIILCLKVPSGGATLGAPNKVTIALQNVYREPVLVDDPASSLDPGPVYGMPYDVPSVGASLIYPNPVSDELHVALSVSSEVLLYQADGSLLQRRALSAGAHALSLAGRPAGAYLLCVASEGGEDCQRVVKK